jgi:hypothetical protein
MQRTLGATSTIVTVGTTTTKVASSHHTLGPGSLVLGTKAACRGGDVATGLGQKSFSVAHLVQV